MVNADLAITPLVADCAGGVRRMATESDAPAGFTVGVVPYHWTQVVNIRRDPFETSVGQQQKTLFGMGGAIASPSTAYVYDWNMLPSRGFSGIAKFSQSLQSQLRLKPN